MKKLCANKLDNLEEMDKFLEAYPLPRLNHEEIKHLNRPKKSKEIESVIKKLPRRKSPRPNSFPGEFYPIFKKEFMLILFKLFQNQRREYSQTHYKRVELPCYQNQIWILQVKTTGQYPWWIYAKILCKTLANQIQQHIERVIPQS